MGNIWIPFLLTLLAGMSTMIGASIAFFVNKSNKKFLSISLGFSAGVMIYISMAEILPEAKIILIKEFGKHLGIGYSVLMLFLGMLIMGLIDWLVPSEENPHELRDYNGVGGKTVEINSKRVQRTGILMAISIGIHNFPEGISTFITSIQDLKLGMAIAFAVAIHNIPEGISVSIPIFYATGSRKKAFYYSSLSGVSEVVGAFFAYFFLFSFLTPALFGMTLSLVSGLMIYISFDELLPAAEEYGNHHLSLLGLIMGMLIMALSLIGFV
ncbi:MAG: zinc transporter ZupT [Deltaproteobacteria bacterium]|nr:zinc transporter ZupT [Deltaproteobacteria bacterium]